MDLFQILAKNKLDPTALDNLPSGEVRELFKQYKAEQKAQQAPTKFVDSSGANTDLVNLKALGKQSRAIQQSSVAPESVRSIVRADTEYWLDKFITQDPDTLTLKDNVRKLSKLKHPVLICGETGTGKELIARALHGNRSGMFQAINCGGFPEHLIESELFGHVTGSFTGAYKDKIGLFHSAQDGTLFLDEIGELPLLMQTKLLRVLQERVVRPVGAVESIHVNCRVVCATNRDVQEMIEEGTFRSDLYWRISAFELFIKPLRLRPKDIPLITEKLGKRMDNVNSAYLNGNVRELERMVLRALNTLT